MAKALPFYGSPLKVWEELPPRYIRAFFEMASWDQAVSANVHYRCVSTEKVKDPAFPYGAQKSIGMDSMPSRSAEDIKLNDGSSMRRVVIGR